MMNPILQAPNVPLADRFQCGCQLSEGFTQLCNPVVWRTADHCKWVLQRVLKQRNHCAYHTGTPMSRRWLWSSPVKLQRQSLIRLRVND